MNKGKSGNRAWALGIACLSLFGLLLIWQIASGFANPRYLPAPLLVLRFVIREVREGELLFHLGVTLARVGAAFFISMILGTVIGLFLGRNRLANQIFDSWLTLLLNIPALVIIVLAFIWFGLNDVTAVCAVALNKLPTVIVTMREGARALDPAFAEVGNAYRLSRYDRWRHVTLPQLQPFLAAASRSGLALIWKIVLVVELLGRSNGVGFQIHLYFQLFDVRAILGYTLSFVVVMLLIETLLVQPFERKANLWRGQNA